MASFCPEEHQVACSLFPSVSGGVRKTNEE